MVNGLCRICRKAPATQKDHIWPRSMGGTDDPSNLQPVCAPCNSAKGSTVPNGMLPLFTKAHQTGRRHRLTVVQFLILRHLAEEGPTYGLKLVRTYELKGGSLYPALNSLQRRGLVVSQWEDIDEHAAGRRRRRYYKITGPGRVAFNKTNQQVEEST